jgi:hypothetical protein
LVGRLHQNWFFCADQPQQTCRWETAPIRRLGRFRLATPVALCADGRLRLLHAIWRARKMRLVDGADCHGYLHGEISGFFRLVA